MYICSIFFFKQKTAYEIIAGDWSSDVCSSDLDITRRLIEAAKILGIRIVDHIIIGRPSADTPGHVSLREKTLVAFELPT